MPDKNLWLNLRPEVCKVSPPISFEVVVEKLRPGHFCTLSVDSITLDFSGGRLAGFACPRCSGSVICWRYFKQFPGVHLFKCPKCIVCVLKKPYRGPLLRAHWSALLGSQFASPFIEDGDVVVGGYDDSQQYS